VNTSEAQAGLTLVDVADDLIRSALISHRCPTHFTIGSDIETRIIWQLAVQNAGREDAREVLGEYAVESLSIMGLPVFRMVSSGIALHTQPLKAA